MAEPCILCTYLEAQNTRLQDETLRLRLQLANSEATTSARSDLERVNARLAEANAKIRNLEEQVAIHKGVRADGNTERKATR
jgi:hypothetical protein